MVELGAQVAKGTQELIDFVREIGVGVIASNSGTGHPESAYVHLAATDRGTIVLGTDARSRKFTNISSDPRVSLVLVQRDSYSIQLEGEAQILDEAGAAAAGPVLAAQHPDAQPPQEPEHARLLEITVRWAQHTDATATPPVQRELDLG